MNSSTHNESGSKAFLLSRAHSTQDPRGAFSLSREESWLSAACTISPPVKCRLLLFYHFFTQVGTRALASAMHCQRPSCELLHGESETQLAFFQCRALPPRNLFAATGNVIALFSSEHSSSLNICRARLWMENAVPNLMGGHFRLAGN